jgi:sulfatase modifying factor 1
MKERFEVSAIVCIMILLLGGSGCGEKDKKCTVGYSGDTCSQCATEYIGYPTCHIPTGDEFQSTTMGDIVFRMMYAPGGTFPIGTGDDDVSILNGFWMGETEVTYEMWKKVYDWATTNDNNTGKRVDGGQLYSFANPGRQGGDANPGLTPVGDESHPVTTINWRDAMVWCNAASEMAGGEAAGYEPVYKNGSGGVIWNSTDDNSAECDSVTPSSTAKGFRLPSSMEWECAARYRGTDQTNTVQKEIQGVNFTSPTDGVYWTKGDSASGATANCNDKAANDAVAVYDYYFKKDHPAEVTSTAAAKSRGDSGKNTLGIYDMSGNVYEWCFDDSSGTGRVIRGGSWGHSCIGLQVGFVDDDDPHGTRADEGFRLVRTK